jgi:hypothetical protein
MRTRGALHLLVVLLSWRSDCVHELVAFGRSLREHPPALDKVANQGALFVHGIHILRLYAIPLDFTT